MQQGNTEQKKNSRLYILILTAIGVVYGDIGTSPLYAVRECFAGLGGMDVNEKNIFGIISLIFWSLILVISVKYLVFVMRADNKGEGGILALMQAVVEFVKGKPRAFIVAIGLFGAALLYGDGMITPAISVISAVEGLKVATPVFEPYIIPITVIILFGLFYFQKSGTSGVGKIFGPIMVFWFSYLALLGVVSIVQSPEILAALNPYHAIEFFMVHGWRGILVLGSVFLVVTGGEALYADMGHFSKRSIRLGWFSFVLPALVINYLGQGALLLRSPEAIDNPFYRLSPDWALYPSVVIATIATIIASQAIISGVFSLTYQAVNLGYFPRFNIIHTSKEEKGQVYLPAINWILFVATVLLVFGFRDSSSLAAAYGVAVSTTMVITTMLAYVAMRKLWGWHQFYAIGLSVLFLLMDLSFFTANMFKISDGGWFPLLVAALVYLVMSTWLRGRQILQDRIRHSEAPSLKKLDEINTGIEHIIKGTAVYLTSNPERIPPPLLLNFRYNRVVHERVLIMTIYRKNTAHIDFNNLTEVEEIGKGFYKVKANYGFKDRVSVRRLIPILAEKIDGLDPDNVTFVIGTKDVLPKDSKKLWRWRKNLFVFMQQNDAPATRFYNIPPERVIEIGSQMTL